MHQRLAVIGCGNMGRAIVRGLLESGWTEAAKVVTTNPDAEKTRRIEEELGVRCITDNAKAAAEADVVLLGLKPQVIKPALKELRGVVRADQLILSIAAGISTRFIEHYTADTPVVRSMPNLAVTIGMGATAVCPGTHARRKHMELSKEIFQSVGMVEEVQEYQMDAVTGLSGTGPMYVFHLLESMADAGVKMGLPRGVSARLAAQTVRGSAWLAMESDAHPAALKDLVTSPGGTAITALHVLRRHAFAAIMMDAVEAATRRSAELGE